MTTTQQRCLFIEKPLRITPQRPQSQPVAGILGRGEVAEIGGVTVPIARERVTVTKLDPRFVVKTGPQLPFFVEPEPRLHLRVRAVVAYDKGTPKPMTEAEARERIAALVETANKDFEGTGLRLLFFPKSDIEFIEDSLVRRDIDLSAEDIQKLESGTLTEAAGDALIAAAIPAVVQRRKELADEKPSRLLWLFSPGNRVEKLFDETTKKFAGFKYHDNRGGSFSGGDAPYVAINSWIISSAALAKEDASRIVHETGHYLSLWHTHREPWHAGPQFTKEQQTLSATERLQLWKDFLVAEIQKALPGNKSLATVREFYDSDRAGNVFDTPADPSAGLIALVNEAAGHGSNPHGPVGSVELKVPGVAGTLTLAPLRNNPMSYFLDDKTAAKMHFTADQIKQMRAHLAGPVRRPLVAAQLGDTASPDIRVCAVWNPNDKAQRLTWGHARESHDAEHAKQRANGMALVHVQAYTRKNAVRFDGIWNPGKQQQEVALSLTEAQINADHAARVAKGLRPVRLNGYQHLAQGTRYNAIYEPGTGDSQLLLGVTKALLFDEYEKAKKKGMRMTSLAAQLDPDGNARYSAILRTSNMAQAWVTDRTIENIQEEYEKRRKEGFRIRDLTVLKTKAGHRWTALFEPGSFEQTVYWSNVRERITEAYDEMWAGDFKLRSMCVVSA